MNPLTTNLLSATTPCRAANWPALSIFLLALASASLSGAEPARNSTDSLSIATPFLRVTIVAKTGHCEIYDLNGGVAWGRANPNESFGLVTVKSSGKSSTLPLGLCDLESIDQKRAILATFHPLSDNPTWALRVRMTLLPDQRSIQLRTEPEPGVEVEKVSPLANIITVTNKDDYLLVPTREGLLIPADSGLRFNHRFETYAYEGCHMAMMGAVQESAALLATWDDPYVALEVKSTVLQPAPETNRQALAACLALSKSANAFRIHCLGRGDYVTMAKAYRHVAQEKGFAVTWEQKLKTHPDRAKLFGAANIKLWSTLDRRMNEDSTKEESVHVNWTFAEAAQVAEHYKKDLQLDHVLFTIGGWIHRGYDNQHPDILPTAPECGGDDAFANCARRVMDQGYLFCLHDNYQDIYHDSPSWNERLVMKTPDGRLARGGHWAGGTAFLTCSKMALELAQRAQNLPAVKQLSKANSYFIDTTYAAGLQECFDPEHPLTRADDMKWKQALSDYARGVFGVFGSECGREWAIPHSDFFEGLTGVSGRAYHDAKLADKLGATVVPLFDLVYHDCIAMYGKYGYDPKQAALYVLQHITFARPLNYHSIPPHLYWTNTQRASAATHAPGNLDLFTRAENGWAAGLHEIDRFIKNTCEILCPLNELTALMPMTRHEFLSSNRKVQRSIFGEGQEQVAVTVNMSKDDYTCTSTLGGELRLPPLGFLAESPQFVAFYSQNWNRADFSSPAMFTLRSADGKALRDSHNIRVFHAFGDENIRLGTNLIPVVREQIVEHNIPATK